MDYTGVIYADMWHEGVFKQKFNLIFIHEVRVAFEQIVLLRHNDCVLSMPLR